LAPRTGYGNLSREGQPRSSSQAEDINRRDDQANHEGKWEMGNVMAKWEKEEVLAV